MRGVNRRKNEGNIEWDAAFENFVMSFLGTFDSAQSQLMRSRAQYQALSAKVGPWVLHVHVHINTWQIFLIFWLKDLCLVYTRMHTAN